MTEKSRSKFRNGWIQRLNSYDKGVCLSQSLTFLPPFCLLLFCLRNSPMRKALGFTPFQLHIQQKRRDSLPPGLKESPRIRCHWPSLHHVHTPQQSLGSGLQQTLLKLGQRVRKESLYKENTGQILRGKTGWRAGSKINAWHLDMSIISEFPECPLQT